MTPIAWILVAALAVTLALLVVEQCANTDLTRQLNAERSEHNKTLGMLTAVAPKRRPAGPAVARRVDGRGVSRS